MEYISSRKNNYIKHLRALAASNAYRCEAGEYVCGGMRLLREALAAGAQVTGVLWSGEPELEIPGVEARSCPGELLEYASALASPQSPIFTVRIPETELPESCARAIILDGVQNPGNVGTIIRTAAALSFGPVILAPGCADKYNPKTVHGAMGALFRHRVLDFDLDGISDFLKKYSLRVFGADLAPGGLDVRELPRNAAIAIGAEGSGLGSEIRAILDGAFKIPIAPEVESLNAAVAAAVAMWEMTR